MMPYKSSHPSSSLFGFKFFMAEVCRNGVDCRSVVLHTTLFTSFSSSLLHLCWQRTWGKILVSQSFPDFFLFVHYALKETKADTALPFHITESFISITAKVQTRLQLHMNAGYIAYLWSMIRAVAFVPRTYDLLQLNCEICFWHQMLYDLCVDKQNNNQAELSLYIQHVRKQRKACTALEILPVGMKSDAERTGLTSAMGTPSGGRQCRTIMPLIGTSFPWGSCSKFFRRSVWKDKRQLSHRAEPKPISGLSVPIAFTTQHPALYAPVPSLWQHWQARARECRQSQRCPGHLLELQVSIVDSSVYLCAVLVA